VALFFAFRQPAITIFAVLAAWAQAVWTSKQRSSARSLTTSILFASAVAFAADDAKRWLPDIPKVWDEAALEDWIAPLAGLNVRPTHMSAKEYYSMPEWNFRSYPVYMPGTEPEGYWEMLQRIGPKALIEPEKLKTEADWIEAGRQVFEEALTPQLTTFDPTVIAQFRSGISGTARCQTEAERHFVLPVGTYETGSGPFARRKLRRLPRPAKDRRYPHRRRIRARRSLPRAPIPGRGSARGLLRVCKSCAPRRSAVLHGRRRAWRQVISSVGCTVAEG
jgi:hypothetical protein